MAAHRDAGHPGGGPAGPSPDSASDLTVDFSASEELKAIRDGVRKVASRFPPGYWQEHDTTRTFPSEYWAAVGQNGWLNALVPEEYGGSGLGTLEMAVIIEELVAGGAGGTGGIVLMANLCFGTISVLRYGTEEQKRKYLPMMGDGRSIIALAIMTADHMGLRERMSPAVQTYWLRLIARPSYRRTVEAGARAEANGGTLAMRAGRFRT
jgi:hypothetical protein